MGAQSENPISAWDLVNDLVTTRGLMNGRLKIGLIGVAVVVLCFALAGRVGRASPPVELTYRGIGTNGFGHDCLVYALRNVSRDSLRMHVRHDTPSGSTESADTQPREEAVLFLPIGSRSPPYRISLEVEQPAHPWITRAIQWLEGLQGRNVAEVSRRRFAVTLEVAKP